MLERIRVFTGNANLELARKITENLGVTLGKAHVTSFSDGIFTDRESAGKAKEELRQGARWRVFGAQSL